MTARTLDRTPLGYLLRSRHQGHGVARRPLRWTIHRTARHAALCAYYQGAALPILDAGLEAKEHEPACTRLPEIRRGGVLLDARPAGGILEDIEEILIRRSLEAIAFTPECFVYTFQFGRISGGIEEIFLASAKKQFWLRPYSEIPLDSAGFRKATADGSRCPVNTVAEYLDAKDNFRNTAVRACLDAAIHAWERCSCRCSSPGPMEEPSDRLNQRYDTGLQPLLWSQHRRPIPILLAIYSPLECKPTRRGGLPSV